MLASSSYKVCLNWFLFMMTTEFDAFTFLISKYFFFKWESIIFSASVICFYEAKISVTSRTTRTGTRARTKIDVRSIRSSRRISPPRTKIKIPPDVSTIKISASTSHIKRNESYFKWNISGSISSIPWWHFSTTHETPKFKEKATSEPQYSENIPGTQIRCKIIILKNFHFD